MDMRRMNLLLKAVEDAPDERFNMCGWAVESLCGTVHCAAGWYAANNPAEGITYFTGNCYGGLLINGQVCSFRKLARHFGISFEESTDLFYPGAYSIWPKREIVAERIRRFIACSPLPSASMRAECGERQALDMPKVETTRETVGGEVVR